MDLSRARRFSAVAIAVVLAGTFFVIPSASSAGKSSAQLRKEKAALEKQLGQGALEKFDEDAKDNMQNMNKYSKILYENFKKLLI